MNVSRETAAQLAHFSKLVEKWTKSIGLVSKQDASAIMSRHVQDCIPVADLIYTSSWLDFGSGGGFPGLVVAIMHPNTEVTLVESDQRKCAFLRTASGELGLRNTNVQQIRIEKYQKTSPVISARAVASISKLLSLCMHCATENTRFIFPKGRRWKEEVDEARAKWHFDFIAHSSQTEKDSAILEMKNVARK